MNAVEKLLKLDAGKISAPEKVIKITPKKLGIELDFPCVAIDPDRFAEIQETGVEMRKGRVKRVKSLEIRILIIINGCPSVFKSKELQEHFGAPTPKELVKKLLLSGEIDDLYTEISKLSGYEKDEEEDEKEEEEIKN